MAKAITTILMVAALSGCSGPREVVRYEPIEVLVPVAVPCPEPPILVRPPLPFAQIDSASTPAEVMRAYVASSHLLMGYAKYLEQLLDAYRKPTVNQPPN